MTAEMILFGIFAFFLVLTALGVVFSRSPVYAAMNLVAAFFFMAGIYVLLTAHLIAFMQVLVYAGAVMVLFLFVIMLLNLGRGAGQDRKGVIGVTVGVMLAATLFVQLKFLRQAAPPALIQVPGAMAQLQQQHGMVGSVAGPLYDAYLVPFEITSVLLLAAVVGAVVLAKRKL